MPCSGNSRSAHPGETCLPSLVLGKPFIAGSESGRIVVSSNRSSKSFVRTTIPTWRMSAWTRRPFGSIKRALGLKKIPRTVENQAIGRSAGGLTTKIHVVVDGLGNPLKMILTGGQVHDSQVAQPLISQLKIAGVNVIADKAYGSEAFRQYLEAEEGTYTIPPKSNAKEKWPVDYYVYRERHLIENFFNQLKNFWRIATRYDKLAHVYLERVYLAAILIRLK